MTKSSRPRSPSTLVVPGEVASLSAIAEYVIAAGKAAGLDRHAVYRLRLAVDEIATNVVIHGYDGNGNADGDGNADGASGSQPGPLQVTATIADGAVTVCIEDTGPPYDPRDAAAAIPEVPLHERDEGGLGLFLATHYADYLDYERDGDKNRNIIRVALPDSEDDPAVLRAKVASLQKRNAELEALVYELRQQSGNNVSDREFVIQAEQLLRLEGEIKIGREIQGNFLPDRLPDVPGWQLAAHVQPARLVSGDFYDAFGMGGGCIGLVIADVCDKGVGAAIFMALIRSLLRAFAQIDWIAEYAASRSSRQKGDSDSRPSTQPAAPPNSTFDENTLYRLEVILRRSVCLTNDYVAYTHRTLDMFVTFFFGILVPKTGQLLYINSGHPPLLLCGPQGVRQRLSATGPATGILVGADFAVEEVTIAPGELLLGYTDGVTDARSATRERFGPKRLLACVGGQPFGAGAVVERIDEALAAHAGDAEQFDDYTLLAAYRMK